MSEPKFSLQISQISSNDRDGLTKWGHQLVEQAIYTFSGNGGDVITLIIHIHTNNLILVHKLND